MVDQILIAQEDMGQRVSNVVAMGQGEPFLNYDSTCWRRCASSTMPKLLKIGARRITRFHMRHSCRAIDRFAQRAGAIHAGGFAPRRPPDPCATSSCPRWTNQPLSQTQEGLADTTSGEDRSGASRLEYLLIDGINDSEEDLAALIDFCSGTCWFTCQSVAHECRCVFLPATESAKHRLPMEGRARTQSISKPPCVNRAARTLRVHAAN